MLQFWLKSLFLLPGTFLHELMHLLTAWLLGARVHSFSILPKYRHNNGKPYMELGSVGFSSRIDALNFIIAFAPLLLWVMLWFVLEHVGVIVGSYPNFSFYFSNLLTLESWWVWLVSYQLIVGGIPSSVDVKLAIKGFFSFSGLLLFLGLYLYFFQYEYIASYVKPVLHEVTNLYYTLRRSF